MCRMPLPLIPRSRKHSHSWCDIERLQGCHWRPRGIWKVWKKQQDPMVVHDFHPWNLKLLFGVEVFFRHINIVINPCHAMPPLISLEFRNALEGLYAPNHVGSRTVMSCIRFPNAFGHTTYAFNIPIQKGQWHQHVGTSDTSHFHSSSNRDFEGLGTKRGWTKKPGLAQGRSDFTNACVRGSISSQFFTRDLWHCESTLW
jgi:hypothetical protein